MSGQWHVLGAGAVGGLFADRLHALGEGVVLLSRKSDASVRTLHYRNGSKSHSTEFPQESVSGAGSIHQLLVTTKAQDVVSAVASVLPRLNRSSMVVIMANGMGYHAAVHDLLGDIGLVVGTTSAGCHCPRPDVRVLAGKGITQMGWFATDAPPPSNLESWLASDWNCQWDADIDSVLIQKLAVNCAINPLTALLDVCNGELLSPAHRTLFDRGIREIVARLDWAGRSAAANALPRLAEKVALDTRDNTSSMRSDVLENRGTEVDYMLGYLLEELRGSSVEPPPATPLLDAWLSDLRQRAPGRR